MFHSSEHLHRPHAAYSSTTQLSRTAQKAPYISKTGMNCINETGAFCPLANYPWYIVKKTGSTSTQEHQAKTE